MKIDKYTNLKNWFIIYISNIILCVCIYDIYIYIIVFFVIFEVKYCIHSKIYLKNKNINDSTIKLTKNIQF